MRGRFGDGSQVCPAKECQSVPEQNVPTQDVPGQAVPKQEIPKQTVPKREEAGRGVGPEVSDRGDIPDRDVDLATLRARLRALIREKLLASPMMQKMYADLVIASAPESEEAKLLAQNYQKILNRITMANPKSCIHIKVNGVRCESPALRGEQFCYFHQHAHRGVRHPARSRLHPMALIESQESIQASLMEVINGLLRNTLDTKRAELILRALHIAVKNARYVKFDSEVYPKVREIPEYAEPATDAVETDAFGAPLSEMAADPADESLPAVAAVPYAPVDPRDPHFLERFEEGGRVLAREAAERRAAEARAARSAEDKRDGSRGDGRDASTALSMTGERDTKDGNTTVDPTKRKPPVNVKAKTATAQAKSAAAPKERKNAAQRASAG